MDMYFYNIMKLIQCTQFSLLISYQKNEFIDKISGLDINVCLIPAKTDVGQVDLVLRLSDGTSEKIRDS